MARDLLVPGTGGTKLLLDGDDIGWPGELTVAGWAAKRAELTLGFERLGAKYGAPENIRKVLSMQYADDATALVPEKTTLWPGGSIAPGPTLGLVYNQFADFEPFLYDWRQDIRRSGDLLLEKLTSAPGEPWRIVCHSQGGLVVVAAARKLADRTGGADSDRAFSRIVSHVAFVGVPFHGTLQAADAFIKGETLAAPVAAEFKRVARTWPALYQMLPTWPSSVRVPDGAGGTTNLATNLTYDEHWAGQEMVPSMLERARVTRRNFLRAPMASFNGVKKRIFQSRAFPTPDHVVKTAAGLQVSGAVEGDTLVPDTLTRDMGGDIQAGLTLSIGQNGNTLVHSMLANDPVFATGVKDFLAQ
jgi:pimeloyl-ACP methyl ester carboxylesterase